MAKLAQKTRSATAAPKTAKGAPRAPRAPTAPRRRQIAAQSLASSQIEDALLKIASVRELTGMSRSTIYARMAAGTFVKPLHLSPRAIRFRAGDITTWLRQQAGRA